MRGGQRFDKATARVVSATIDHGVVSKHRSAKERRPDSQQLTRQWALLRLQSDATGPYSVTALAEQLDTSKATIVRNLQALVGSERLGALREAGTRS
jgi:hypothetical protein